MENSLLQENEVFILIIIGIITMISLAFSFVLFFYYFQKRLLSEEVKAQEQLVYHTLHAQEEERKRLARELHDAIGSKLNVIHLYLHQLKKKKGLESEFDATLKNTNNVLQNVISSSRKIAHFLMPVTLEKFGFYKALEELCQEFEGTGLINIHLKNEEEDTRVLKKEIQLDLFRIFQELLNNSYKHSNATDIEIEITTAPQKFLLSYKDNGKGFDMEKTALKKGLGMKSIKTRLEYINADWEINSTLGQGIHLKITINE